MSTKIHPHLKSFIKSVVMAEMSNIGPSKKYIWKENLMKEVIASVLENVENIKTDVDLKEEIKKHVLSRKQEIISTLDMIEGTLKNVPLDVLKQTK